MNEIRFDLEDIIEGNLIEDVLLSLQIMAKKMEIKKVVFWHNDKITQNQIDEFRDKSAEFIQNQISIRITQRHPRTDFVWFDVINNEKSIGSKSRFSHVYPSDKKAELLRGIHNFFNVVTFIAEANQSKRVYYKPKDNNK